MIVMEFMVTNFVHKFETIFHVALKEFGSLHELLHNETVPIERELAMQFLRDISQGSWIYTVVPEHLHVCSHLLLAGMLFLHSSVPPICHADLKSSNIL